MLGTNNDTIAAKSVKIIQRMTKFTTWQQRGIKSANEFNFRPHDLLPNV